MKVGVKKKSFRISFLFFLVVSRKVVNMSDAAYSASR